MSIRKTAAIVACFAFVGYVRRVAASVRKHTSRQIDGKDGLWELRVLARLFLALDSSAAFNPTSRAVHGLLGTGNHQGHRPVVVTEPSTRGHSPLLSSMRAAAPPDDETDNGIRTDTSGVSTPEPHEWLLSFLPKLPATRAWPSSFSEHILRGIGMAIAESIRDGGLSAGGSSALRLSKMAVDELLFYPLQKIPYAVRILYHRALNMQLETTARLPIEVYERGGKPGGPLVLFVHGGSWGQGAAWQYPFMAQRLLEEGASKVAIAQYSLFPDGDVGEMLEDVDAALNWCRIQQEEHAKASDASDPALRVVLAAQSAGAHLCALHFSRRSWHDQSRGEASWLPDRFVALSGVFDIGPHFAHERTRLVHWLSPMWRAMIGKDSSATGVAAIMAHAMRDDLNESSVSTLPLASLTDDLGSLADAVAAVDVTELATAGISCTSVAADARGPASATIAEAAAWCDSEMAAWAAASPTRILRLRGLASARVAESAKKHSLGNSRALWPPTTVLHAADDKTVPVSSARAFIRALEACGCAPDQLHYREYEQAGHGEIMFRLVSREAFAKLPAIAQDFTRAVCDCQ